MQTPIATAVEGRPRVLLAEDNDAFRSLLAQALRRSGYDVVETPNARTLIDHLTRCRPVGPLAPPDLVLSDIRMPGGDGLGVLRQARQWGTTVPFVLMTAFGDEGTHAQARSLGARAVLDKPFTVDDLLELVGVVCGHRGW